MNNQCKQTGLFILMLLPLLSITAQNNLIPNEQDCSATRPHFAFTIKEAWVSNTGKKVDARHTPLVGDIDGDGNVEVFADNGMSGSAVGGILYVFEGKTGALAGQINCPGIPGSGSTARALRAVIFKRNAAAKGSVFIAGANDSIYLYEVRSSARPLLFDLVWKKKLSTTVYVSGIAAYVGSVPVVADLNDDGNVEIIAGKYIIDANSGNTVATLGVTSGGEGNPLHTGFPMVADLDGDGFPEVITGNCVYNFFGGAIPAAPTPWRRCPRYGTVFQEGSNAVADINQDGKVDLVYRFNNQVTVWTPMDNSEVGRITLTSATENVSYPFVGDIDGIVTNGKKYPEICINTSKKLYAYSYNGTGFVKKWEMAHTDESGATSLTMFDFNNDEVMELVYRDETHLRIFDGSGSAPAEKFEITCGSATILETPVIADVTGDGSANIIVTGNHDGSNGISTGEVMVFEGAESKWASCPKVWNQQLYSNLLVNEDLTIPRRVKQVNHTYICPDNSTVQYYNGGPMQAPYISDATYLPIELSADLNIISGSITILSPSSVSITITVENQGMVIAKANTPIRYYQNKIAPANILAAVNTTLGVDLAPGASTVITKTITGLTPMPFRFYVRLLDDGVNFPASGPFGDCNLSNNVKSFGTIELTKTAETSSCLDGTTTFNIILTNNSQNLNNPTTYYDIVVTDSLGKGWTFLNAYPSFGAISSPYNAGTNQLQWTIPSLAAEESVRLVVTAQANETGSLHNNAWIQSMNGVAVDRETMEAYVIVASTVAHAAPAIFPAGTVFISSGGSIFLTASGVPGGTAIQWYCDGIPIPEANGPTYNATVEGDYNVSCFDGNCISQWSNTVTVTIGVDPPSPTQIELMCGNTTKTLVFNNAGPGKPYWFKTETAADNATNDANPSGHAASGTYSFTKNDIQGVQKLYVRVQNDAGTAWISPTKVDTVKVFLVPDSLVWTGDAMSSDWNDVGNWNYVNNPDPSCTECLPYHIPRECTNVLIPANRNYYPDLAESITNYSREYYETASVNNIWFAHGGEVARTDSLHYSRAHVELSLAPDRWHMTSAPLQSMFPGDYYKTDPNPFKDKLAVYTQLFARNNPQTGKPDTEATGGWTGFFNKPDVPMPAGFGFAVWLDDELVPNATAAQHSMWFPKYDTEYYYYDHGGNPIGNSVPIPRSNGHRFIYESVWDRETGVITFDIQADAGKSVIVGNPFMSHWKFEEFQEENSGINNEYKLLLSNNDAAFTTWTPDVPNGLTNRIAPMQSIIVTTNNVLNDLKTKATATTTYQGAMLRSGSNDNPPGVLTIVATKDNSKNSTAVLFDEQATNNYWFGEDSYKLFVNAVKEPVAVYTRSLDNYALDINLFGDCTQPVPIGIRTSKTGVINLQFYGIENFMPEYDVFLLDTKNGNAKINLREMPEYSFKKTTSDLFLDGRFFLSFNKSITGIPTSKDVAAAVFVNDNQLQVICNNTIIKEIQVVDIHGKMVLRDSNIESTFYTNDLPRSNFYIVKILTKNGVVVKKVTSNR